jgi:hypothetical protein
MLSEVGSSPKDDPTQSKHPCRLNASALEVRFFRLDDFLSKLFQQCRNPLRHRRRNHYYHLIIICHSEPLSLVIPNRAPSIPCHSEPGAKPG